MLSKHCKYQWNMIFGSFFLGGPIYIYVCVCVPPLLKGRYRGGTILYTYVHICIYICMYICIWLYMIVYDCIWLYMVVWSVWLYMIVYDCICMFHSLNRNPIRFQSFTPFPHLLPLFLGDEVWIHFGDIVLPGCSLVQKKLENINIFQGIPVGK